MVARYINLIISLTVILIYASESFSNFAAEKYNPFTQKPDVCFLSALLPEEERKN